MTREEAIKEIKDASDSEVRYGDIDNHYDKVMKRVEAFEMAIKALEQQPSADCISRAEAIRVAEQGQIQGYEWQFKKLCDLPFATPQQNTGHWFIDERPESDRELVCSNCDQPIFKYHKLEFDYRPKYCPNCGAKMKSEE